MPGRFRLSIQGPWLVGSSGDRGEWNVKRRCCSGSRGQLKQLSATGSSVFREVGLLSGDEKEEEAEEEVEEGRWEDGQQIVGFWRHVRGWYSIVTQ